MRAVNRRRVGKLVMVVSAMAGGACAALSRTAHSPLVTYPLVVTNHSDFEVVVYALPSVGSVGVRLGNARSFATTTMNIPRNALRGSDMLVVRLHAIGSSDLMTWTSQGVIVDSTVVAQLDIRADGNGNLSRSVLYTAAGTRLAP
jgi:hypothetical protein